MFIRRLLIALLTLLILAPSASALDAETVASAAWPDSPCAGRVVVHYDAGATLDAAYPDGVRVDGAHGEPPDGMAGGNCEVWMRAPRRPQDGDQCNELVHEYGHLAGRDHQSEENEGIMHLGYWGDPSYYDCWLVTAVSPYREARRSTSWSWPCRLARKAGSVWRYRCGRHVVYVDVIVRLGAPLADYVIEIR